MATDYENAAYDDIMLENGEKSGYESLQQQQRGRGLPAVPAVPAVPAESSSANQEVTDSTQTGALLKRYKAAVIVLSVLCVLLVLAVILVYIFLGRTSGSIHNQEQMIPGCTTKWKAMEGQSSPGGVELVVSSVELCQSVCEGMYSCQAVDYSPNPHICWLHTQTTSLGDIQRDVTRTQYILITRCVQQVIDDQQKTSPGLNYTSTVAATAAPTAAPTVTTTTMIPRFPKDCQGYREAGITQSGVYPVQIITSPVIDVVAVYCDMLSDGGGWTTLLKREDGSMPFENHRWADYKYGFGAVSREHWIGNDFMNELTLNNGDLYELRFDLEAFDGEKRFAKYQHFAVANETAKYQLYLGSYSGDAGDNFVNQADMKFSTIDNDNDIYSKNCAVLFAGGWWYRDCHRCMLTGIYGSTAHADGVNWSAFKGQYESLKYADMKVRPSSRVKKSCKALKESGVSNNGVYDISLHIGAIQPTSITVYCDQTSQGGGWMLILKRTSVENEDFNRDWADYRAGFGEVDGEFWLGLETLHKMTSTVVIYELYIELKTSSDDIRYIIYSSFKVTAESDDYRLVLGPVKEGDLVDSLQGNNGQPFSTRDTDNDNDWEQNCAQVNAGGWWYNLCTEALLTGRDDPGAPVEQRLRWKNWLGTGEEFPPIDEATMMIRPVD